MSSKTSESGKKTPLMRQYEEIKASHTETLLLFRVGDFYETFSDDARTLSEELGITLTKRNNGGDQTPLAGFPYHALDTYLPRLVRKGHRVAICEQSEDPESAKKAGRKIVQREVTEITTPGLTLSDQLLSHNRNNYIGSVYRRKGEAGVAFADISTGEFVLADVSGSELKDLLEQIEPSELLLSRKEEETTTAGLDRWNRTWMDEWVYEEGVGYRELTRHFQTHSLKGFGVEELELGHIAGGALLHYIQETQKQHLGQIRRLQRYDFQSYMALDPATRRNLELTSTLQAGEREGTLVSILDATRTAMGGRLLRRWVTRPLKNLEPIHKRLDMVEALHSDAALRGQFRADLDGIGDLERLISRIVAGRTNARELVQLSHSLAPLPELRSRLAGMDDELATTIRLGLHDLEPLRDRITSSLVDEPPASIREGGLFREGVNETLDELRDIAVNGKEYIASIRDQLTKETGISSLKIGYNKVYGYYIEVTHTHSEKVPESFIRKQTLVNSERYITPELKEVEEKILSAEERIQTLEAELFESLRAEVAADVQPIQEVAESIATLDVLQSFAEVSHRNRYVRPDVDDSEVLEIVQGRHPVVEKSLPASEPFIPNDTRLDQTSQQILMVTGPNMAGKSIILRQTGLIVLMAQIGCFVPAERAQIGRVDKIFTRVGASDNLASGESTFLVEMNEAANILNNATRRSLVLLDEVGRGTSTFDGLSIAWSLAEYLHNEPSVQARTLFATHYHELNELEAQYERIRNAHVEVREHEGSVIFMRTLKPGGTDHSYGIQVAKMAGLPAPVIQRAEQILATLEEHRLQEGQVGEPVTGNRKQRNRDAVRSLPDPVPASQMTLFQAEKDPVLEQLRNEIQALDPDRMTPIDALQMLQEFKRRVGSRDNGSESE
ncbi:MAG: DNA mismatch repair protein MutS [Bacteroidota bacterium]